MDFTQHHDMLSLMAEGYSDILYGMNSIDFNAELQTTQLPQSHDNYHILLTT